MVIAELEGYKFKAKWNGENPNLNDIFIVEMGGIVNMCGNFSASVLYPFAAIRETSVCGYQCQGFPRSGACTLDTDIHICYNF